MRVLLNVKGKALIPVTGVAQLSDEGLDANAQRVALESFTLKHDKNLESDDSVEKETRKVFNTHREDSKPSNMTLDQTSTHPVKKDKGHRKPY